MNTNNISKKKLIETVQMFPDHLPMEEVFERIIFMQKVESGLSQLKIGRTKTEPQVKRRLKNG